MYRLGDLIKKEMANQEITRQLANKVIFKLLMLYPSDKQVLKQIAFRENGRDGFCWERKKNIAKRNWLSRQTVHRAYKRLAKANLIVVSWKTIDNKLFVVANTKELGWFIGNFLLYLIRNNLKSFYYFTSSYTKELFNIIYNFIKNNLSNILSSVKGYVKDSTCGASKSGFLGANNEKITKEKAFGNENRFIK
jgi:hypothetical protein